ncbi:MAG: hypothetical protein NVSMB63_03100 [Sediminibacterium sp.]
MKKLLSFLFGVVFVSGAAMTQPPMPKPAPPPPLPRSADKRPPDRELNAQGEHVKSSVDDLVHLRFRRAHEKHVAEARRRNRGIAKDVQSIGGTLPTPPDDGKVKRRPRH